VRAAASYNKGKTLQRHRCDIFSDFGYVYKTHLHFQGIDPKYYQLFHLARQTAPQIAQKFLINFWVIFLACRAFLGAVVWGGQWGRQISI